MAISSSPISAIGRLRQRSKCGTQPVRVAICTRRREAGPETTEKVVSGVFGYGVARVSLSNEPEQVDREPLLAGKLRIGVVALPLGDGMKTGSPAMTDEQVDANKRRLLIRISNPFRVIDGRVNHVVKGGL